MKKNWENGLIPILIALFFVVFAVVEIIIGESMGIDMRWGIPVRIIRNEERAEK